MIAKIHFFFTAMMASRCIFTASRRLVTIETIKNMFSNIKYLHIYLANV